MPIAEVKLDVSPQDKSGEWLPNMRSTGVMDAIRGVPSVQPPANVVVRN